MKTIEELVKDYIKSNECDHDCALCEEICHVYISQESFIDGAKAMYNEICKNYDLKEKK